MIRPGIAEQVYKNNYQFMLDSIQLDKMFDLPKNCSIAVSMFGDDFTKLATTLTKKPKDPFLIGVIKRIARNNAVNLGNLGKNGIGWFSKKIINERAYGFSMVQVKLDMNLYFVSHNYLEILEMATNAIRSNSVSYTISNELFSIPVAFSMPANLEIPTNMEKLGDGSQYYKLNIPCTFDTYCGNITVEPVINKASVTVLPKTGQ